MKIVVFGAAGATGRLVVQEALSAGHEVTAFIRTPGSLPLTDPRLTIVLGDARDEEAVVSAIAGVDAVVSAIGGRARGPSTAITDAMRTIVAALQASRPDARLIAISTVGAGDSGRQMPFPIRQLLGVLLRNAIKDHDGQEAAIMASGLDWTIARCVGLTDDPGRGHATAHPTDKVGGSRIPRADVASWIVANLESDEFSRQAVALW